MSQSTTTSVKDFLPDNCFLNLQDDDINNTCYPTQESDHLRNEHLDLENVESASDSDGDSGSGENDGSFRTAFGRREDIECAKDVSEFFKTGCGCQSVKGKRLNNNFKSLLTLLNEMAHEIC